jgi:hypothetical protein
MNFGEQKGKIEDVLTYSSQRREGLMQLCTALKERLSLELDISRRFEKLSATSFTSLNSPGLEALAGALRLLWQSRAMHAKSLADNIERELVQPLTYYYSIQADLQRTTMQQTRELFKQAKNRLAVYEKGKTRYQKACKDAELLAFSLIDSQSSSEDTKKKIISKLQSSRVEIVLSEEEYKEAVLSTNEFEVEYSSQLVRNRQTVFMTDLAKQELARSERIKTDIGKLQAFEVGYGRRCMADCERVMKALEPFDPESEAAAFTSHTSQQVPVLQPLEFTTYSGSHPLFSASTLSMTRMGDDWTDILRYLTPTSQLNFDIEVLMSRAWHGDEIIESDMHTVPPT